MMTLERKLVHMLGAVIVMIAAYLVRSAAQAHPGHSHTAAAVVAAEDAVKNTLPAAAATAVPLRRITPALLSAPGPAPDPGDSPCRFGCCTPLSFGCCVGMMINAAVPLLPLQRTAGRVIAGPEDLSLGISPESLPKPPKAFV